MQIKQPESCKECVAKKEYEGLMVCTKPAYSETGQVIDISAYKVPEEGVPDWCPTKEINRKLKQLDVDQQKRMKKAIVGLTELFGVEDLIEYEDDEKENWVK